jgi:hypothetical protein
VGLGLLLGPDPASLQLWSRAIVPLLNLFTAMLFPAVWLVTIIAERKQKKNRSFSPPNDTFGGK